MSVEMTVLINYIVLIIGWEIGRAIAKSFQKYNLTVISYSGFGYDEEKYVARKVFGFEWKKKVRAKQK